MQLTEFMKKTITLFCKTLNKKCTGKRLKNTNLIFFSMTQMSKHCWMSVMVEGIENCGRNFFYDLKTEVKCVKNKL